MSRGAALTGALLVTLAQPVTWPLALAAFLIRGGILLVALPVIVLPTPVGVANVIAPLLVSVAFGAISLDIVAVGLLTVTVALAWLVVGGWLAALLEAGNARIAASDEHASGERGSDADPVGATMPSSPRPGRVATRILAARLLAHVPLIVALAWGSARIVLVAYRELTSPVDVATPIVLRVLRASPEVVIAIVITWMIGEIVGAVAARRIALAGDGIVPALRGAIVTVVRSPLSTLVRFWLPTGVLVAIVVPTALAVSSAWESVHAILTDRPDPLSAILAIVMFVTLWAVGLAVLSVVCAWRAAVWTVAAVRSKGTFGGSTDRQPGDWRSDASSANL